MHGGHDVLHDVEIQVPENLKGQTVYARDQKGWKCMYACLSVHCSVQACQCHTSWIAGKLLGHL